MIEFFLSHPAFLFFIFTILFFVSVLWLAAIIVSYLICELDYKENPKEFIKTYIYYPIPALLIIIAVVTMVMNIKQNPTYTEWKQIYTNEQNINILLTDYLEPDKRKSEYDTNKVGDKLGRFYENIQDEFQGFISDEWDINPDYLSDIPDEQLIHPILSLKKAYFNLDKYVINNKLVKNIYSIDPYVNFSYEARKNIYGKPLIILKTNDFNKIITQITKH